MVFEKQKEELTEPLQRTHLGHCFELLSTILSSLTEQPERRKERSRTVGRRLSRRHIFA